MKAIFLDLDGTLNNDQKVITPKTKAALMAAQQEGVHLVLASARPSPIAPPLALPICIGPVGFAETNSIITFLPLPKLLLP